MKLHSPHDSFDHTTLTQLFDNCRSRQLRAGEILSFPQDANDQIFYLQRGRLRVYLSYGDKLLTLTLLQAGDIYSSHTRAFVDALDDSCVALCDLRTFSARVGKHPALNGAVTRVLSQTLSGCIDTIENLAFRDVRARLACFLLGQAPANTADPVRLELQLNTEQMAQMIGTSRQTLSTLLSELQRDGIVKKLQRGQLQLCDRQRLLQIASL
ncbi:Crp/Fnr family transcriptional regulator [Shewanella sp. A32]|uniref:Crp/Fnr family transcriptional regulator n=1 Tax=Shewanella sp. A32 TaxID=3031327 RepID=UPI0023B97F04|nr:Crp/Fnr family transcriptional regulator [Shewanella sp. A32]MDF0533363.1 Crp/Fnr family transcriptional regulator [Shewanella sp. A32]